MAGAIKREEDLRKRERGKTIKAARVENRSGNHRKFYEVYLEEMDDDTYVIRTFWGRIGQMNPGTQVKHAADSIVDAMVVFHDWLIEKETKKGYKPCEMEPQFGS